MVALVTEQSHYIHGLPAGEVRRGSGTMHGDGGRALAEVQPLWLDLGDRRDARDRELA